MGHGIPIHQEYLYGLKEKEVDFHNGGDYELPTVEGKGGKHKHDSDTGIEKKRKRRCCVMQ